MKEVTIDGVRFVEQCDAPEWRICVIDSFVYVGRIHEEDNGDLVIRDARNIIRWGTTKHLGELAASGPLENTKLGERCVVRVPREKIKHLIDTRAELWTCK